jgi:hypothetical protein
VSARSLVEKPFTRRATSLPRKLVGRPRKAGSEAGAAAGAAAGGEAGGPAVATTLAGAAVEAADGSS